MSKADILHNRYRNAGWIHAKIWSEVNHNNDYKMVVSVVAPEKNSKAYMKLHFWKATDSAAYEYLAQVIAWFSNKDCDLKTRARVLKAVDIVAYGLKRGIKKTAAMKAIEKDAIAVGL